MVQHEDVLVVMFQRNFITVAVVLWSKEEPNDYLLGIIALYVQADLEDFVVQLRTFNEDADIVL